MIAYGSLDNVIAKNWKKNEEKKMRYVRYFTSLFTARSEKGGSFLVIRITTDRTLRITFEILIVKL